MAVVVALAAIVAWDRPPTRSAPQGQVAVAVVPPTDVVPAALDARLLAPAGFEHLGRLRVPEHVAESPPPLSPPTPAPATPAEREVRPPPAVFQEPPARPVPTPGSAPVRREQPAATSGGTWAVIVGVNDYPGNEHDLQSAVNDANDVNTALAQFGVPTERRLLLRDRQATGDSIRSAVEWLNTNAGPDSVAVVFYAGHVRKEGSGEALVGADGDAIRDTELAAQLERLQARRAWIAIAACYGAGFSEVVKPGRVLTAAAPADRLAYENPNFGRSYLVEYMVRRAMIEGKAPASVQAAFAYATNELRRDYPNRTPVQIDQTQEPLDLRTQSTRRPSQSPDPAPTSSGGQPDNGGTKPPQQRCGLLFCQTGS